MRKFDSYRSEVNERFSMNIKSPEVAKAIRGKARDLRGTSQIKLFFLGEDTFSQLIHLCDDKSKLDQLRKAKDISTKMRMAYNAGRKIDSEDIGEFMVILSTALWYLEG